MEIKNIIGDNSPGDYEPKVGEDLELRGTKISENRVFVRTNKEEV